MKDFKPNIKSPSQKSQVGNLQQAFENSIKPGIEIDKVIDKVGFLGFRDMLKGKKSQIEKLISENQKDEGIRELAAVYEIIFKDSLKLPENYLKDTSKNPFSGLFGPSAEMDSKYRVDLIKLDSIVIRNIIFEFTRDIEKIFKFPKEKTGLLLMNAFFLGNFGELSTSSQNELTAKVYTKGELDSVNRLLKGTMNKYSDFKGFIKESD